MREQEVNQANRERDFRQGDEKPKRDRQADKHGANSGKKVSRVKVRENEASTFKILR